MPLRGLRVIRAADGPPGLATLVLLSAVSVLSLNLFLPSLNNIAGWFGVDYAMASIAVAGYLAVTAMLQIVIGPLSDRFGRRPVMLASVAIFSFASVGCLVATSIGWFLAFRMLQGAMIAGNILSLAIVRDTYPEREAASRIGYLSMAMGVGPMVGPIIGGLLDESFGWRSTFILYLLMGLLTLLVCWLDLGETNRQRSASFSDQFRSYPALARSGRFWRFASCAAFSTATFYVFLAGTPLVASGLLGLTTGELGIGIGSITAGFVFGSFLAGRLAARFRLITLIMAGRLVAIAGLLVGWAMATTGLTHVLAFFGTTVFVGIGNGLTTPGTYAGAISVRPDLGGSASGITGALTVACGAIFTYAAGTVVSGESGVSRLLGLMLFSTLLSLLAAYAIRRTERPDA